jgi:hypothetical protein
VTRLGFHGANFEVHRVDGISSEILLLNEKICNKKRQLRSNNIKQHLQSLIPHRTNGSTLDTL